MPVAPTWDDIKDQITFPSPLLRPGSYLGDGSIEFPPTAFTDTEKTQILGALQYLFENSPTAQAALSDYLASGEVLEILPTEDGSRWPTSGTPFTPQKSQILIDFDDLNKSFLSLEGEISSLAIEGATSDFEIGFIVYHEFLHVYDAYNAADFPVVEQLSERDYSISDFDLLGSVVNRVNQVRVEMSESIEGTDFPQRGHYWGLIENDSDLFSYLKSLETLMSGTYDQSIPFFTSSGNTSEAQVFNSSARLVDGEPSNDLVVALNQVSDVSTGDGNDAVIGGLGDDVIQLGAGNDVAAGQTGQNTINGGDGFDIAIFSGDFDTWNITQITATGYQISNSVDTNNVVEVELFLFDDGFYDPNGTGLENVVATDGTLIDGPKQSESGILTEAGGGTAGVVSIDAPTFMADGDAEYTVSLAGVGQGLQYNIAYIVDISGSMRGQRIDDAKNGYIELTNQLIDLGIADVANFAVIPFNSGSTLYADLTAQEAIDRIASLGAGGGTSFGPALANAETFFASANTGQTNIAYFLSDGQGSGASASLTSIANVQAFGIGSGANLGSLNIIDSDNAVSLSSSAQLVDVLTGSSVDVTDIDRIEITLDGTLVETITSDQLVNGPLGLQYTGTVSGLDVSSAAQNPVKATVYLSNGTVSGEAELSIASSLNGTSESSDGSTTDVTFGALSTSFDTSAVGTKNVNLLGNNIDNTIMSSNVGGTFSSFGGNDVFSLGDYANSTVDRVIDGGSGYDIIKYTGNYIQSLVTKIGNVIKIGSNTDTITNVEEIRFDDAVLDTATFTVTPLNAPPVAVDDLFGVKEDQTLTGNVLGENGNGSDSDPDGDALTVTLVSRPSEGILLLNADGSFSYQADSDVFDLATPGDVIEQSFTYQIDDGNGGVDQATATIFVTILDDGVTISAKKGKDDVIGTDGGEDILEGGNGKDRIFGLDGADHLSGGNGKDLLDGGEGPDKLYGGNGKDILIGGLGNDELTGGKGSDTFVFGLGEGTDTVLDFEIGKDLIGLVGLTFEDLTIGQSGDDATISADGEALAVLIGVDGLTLDEADVFNFV